MALPPTGVFDHARLRRLRSERSLTQSELGRRAGVTEYTVYEWEVGKTRPSAEHLGSLAALLGVQVSDLYRPPGSGSFLKDLRVLAGLKQAQLVKKFNEGSMGFVVTQSKVSNWERAKTKVPPECAAQYAAVLGITEEQLDEAARNTWEVGHRGRPWTPLIDQREREFKGLAAGGSELEFVYTMTGACTSLTEVLFSRAGMLADESDPPKDEELHFWNLIAQYHFRVIKMLRGRSIEIIAQNIKCDVDVAERARSVIWTLDQHLTVAEDLLGLPREILVPPRGMFGDQWVDTSARENDCK